MRHSRRYDFQGHLRSESRSGDDLSKGLRTYFFISHYCLLTYLLTAGLHMAVVLLTVWQLESSRQITSPAPTSGAAAAEPVSVAADATQVWSSPRRKARSTPRQLTERHRQRHRQPLKPSPEGSTDEAPSEVVRTPRSRRREPRSGISLISTHPMFGEKVVYLIFGHNFYKCRPNFKFLSLVDFQGNSRCICQRDFHLI